MVKMRAVRQVSHNRYDFAGDDRGACESAKPDLHGDSLCWPVVPQTKLLSGLPALSSLSSQKIDPTGEATPRAPKIC